MASALVTSSLSTILLMLMTYVSSPGLGCRVRSCLISVLSLRPGRALTFNAKKCGSLCAINSGSPVHVDLTPFRLGSEDIPALSWSQRYKYLGCPVGTGAVSMQNVSKIKDSFLRDTETIMTSALAECQKLDAYRVFPFSRLTYAMKYSSLPPCGVASSIRQRGNG